MSVFQVLLNIALILLTISITGCSGGGGSGDGSGQPPETTNPVVPGNDSGQPAEPTDPVAPGNGIPTVTAEATYLVLLEENIEYARGLSHDNVSPSTAEKPLELDVYYPINDATNRPVYMFIHGGGFKGGSKTARHIVDMADYFASRGWVFVAINYRTSADIGTLHTGIAPQNWVNAVINTAKPEEVDVGIAMYAAQRDAKAALRWIVANASNYDIDTDYITVGGGSAGAITTIALGITEQEDFRDEISVHDDPTLTTTNLDETYDVKSIVNFWGSNIKLEVFELIYGLYRYDSNDPELFIAHGTNDPNATTPYSESIELKDIYDSLAIYNELVPLVGERHGAWGATVDGKSLSKLSFDFLVERQGLNVE